MGPKQSKPEDRPKIKKGRKYYPPPKGKILSNGDRPDPRNSEIVTQHYQITPEAQQVFEKIKHKIHDLPSTIYKLYDPPASYQGDFSNRLPHGYGLTHFQNQSIYIGEFCEGEANTDEGIFIFPDGSIYEGGFKNSFFHGFGGRQDKKRNWKYVGEFQNGKPNGEGEQRQLNYSFKNQSIQTTDDRDRGESYLYSGTFKDGRRQGYGILKTNKGSYEGNFKNGELNGRGNFLWNIKKLYVGTFMNGKFHGEGKIYYKDRIEEGIWQNDEKMVIKNNEEYDFAEIEIEGVRERRTFRLAKSKQKWLQQEQIQRQRLQSLSMIQEEGQDEQLRSQQYQKSIKFPSSKSLMPIPNEMEHKSQKSEMLEKPPQLNQNFQKNVDL